MIRIVVIEDEIKAQTTVKKIIRELDVFKDEELKVDYFTKYNQSLKDIIKDVSEHKIYIIDIQLETKVSGIDIAKYIRETDWESELIFITNHDKMFETVYRSVFEVFDFIEKFHDFENKLKKDLKKIFNKNFDNKMFKYHNNNFSVQLYYRSINYIYRDTATRKIVIKTDTNSYSISMPLIDSFKYLDSRFIMVHRACIVNSERVEAYYWSKGYFLLDNGNKVDLLSRKYKKEVQEFYERNN